MRDVVRIWREEGSQGKKRVEVKAAKDRDKASRPVAE